MIKVAIVGFGNIGKAAYEAILKSNDFSLTSIVETRPVKADVPVLKDISELKDIDTAILCLPSRMVPDYAPILLSKGISTVDSYDIHTNIAETRTKFNKIAKENNCVSIISAGWDPGSDSIMRAVFKAMLPKGITYTDFGPGMSMGHTVAAKSIPMVKDALSVTVPLGSGIHRRMVYVELEEGASFDEVAKSIKKDDYFSKDETHIIQVDDVNEYKDAGHSVHISRKGVSGDTANQRASFKMSINNPALTGQILVSAARAASRQKPGCYTMIEIPPIDFLEGEKDRLIGELV